MAFFKIGFSVLKKKRDLTSAFTILLIFVLCPIKAFNFSHATHFEHQSLTIPSEQVQLSSKIMEPQIYSSIQNLKESTLTLLQCGNHIPT